MPQKSEYCMQNVTLIVCHLTDIHSNYTKSPDQNLWSNLPDCQISIIVIFFLWNYMKQLVYAAPVENTEPLNFEDATATTRNNRPILERVKDAFNRGVECCINSNG
ncbi:hypothetical protein BDFB_004868, partial [Asbolus verrucosus]